MHTRLSLAITIGAVAVLVARLDDVEVVDRAALRLEELDDDRLGRYEQEGAPPPAR